MRNPWHIDEMTISGVIEQIKLRAKRETTYCYIAPNGIVTVSCEYLDRFDDFVWAYNENCDGRRIRADILEHRKKEKA